jgi:hypothetical protein
MPVVRSPSNGHDQIEQTGWRARGRGRVTSGAHGATTRAWQGSSRSSVRALASDGRGHDEAGPTEQRRGVDTGAEADAH